MNCDNEYSCPNCKSSELNMFHTVNNVPVFCIALFKVKREAIDDKGKVLADLQDPDGSYPMNTSVTETKGYLYIGSLVAPVLGRFKKEKIGL